MCVRALGLWRLCESSPMHTPSAQPLPPAPPRCFHLSLGCCWGDAAFLCDRPALQIAFVLSCWRRRQCWAECKQVLKLFTLSRKGWWKGGINFFFPLVFFIWYTSFVHFICIFLQLCFKSPISSPFFIGCYFTDLCIMGQLNAFENELELFFLLSNHAYRFSLR